MKWMNIFSRSENIPLLIIKYTIQFFLLFKIYFITFFKILSLNMVFGHPILPWHKCGPRPSGTLPMGMVMGLFWHFELFFGQKWSLWTQHWKISEKKIGKKAKKSHQRLLMAAGRGAKMALRLNTVSKFWSLLLDISGLFHLHTKYKQWTSLFSIKIGSAKSLLGPYKILIRKCKQIRAQPGTYCEYLPYKE